MQAKPAKLFQFLGEFLGGKIVFGMILDGIGERERGIITFKTGRFYIVWNNVKKEPVNNLVTYFLNKKHIGCNINWRVATSEMTSETYPVNYKLQQVK